MAKPTVEQLRATVEDLKLQLDFELVRGNTKRINNLRKTIEVCLRNIDHTTISSGGAPVQGAERKRTE
jgi:hypothetical protein